MTKNIKVAVIGAGMMGKNHMKTYKSLNGVELVGVYDIFPEAAKAAAETFGCYHFRYPCRRRRIFPQQRHSLHDGKAAGLH